MRDEGTTKEPETWSRNGKEKDMKAKKTMRRKLARNNKGESREEEKNCCEKRGNGKGHDNEQEKNGKIERESRLKKCGGDDGKLSGKRKEKKANL